MKHLIELLNQQKVSGYEIIKEDVHSVQRFFVLDKLETSRYGDTSDIHVTVYMDHTDQRGKAGFAVYPSDDDQIIVDKIQQAKANALLALNPYYPLVEPSTKTYGKNQPWSDQQLQQKANDVAKMIYGIDHHPDVWINSTEIFVNEKQTTFINSNGVELSNITHWIEVELIPTSKNTLGEEFELYLDVIDDTDGFTMIKTKVESLFKTTLDRAHALSMPTMIHSCPVLISGQMRDMLMKCLLSDASYRTIYEKRNHYGMGQTIGNDGLSIMIKPSDPNVVASNGFDNHGCIIESRTIIDHGLYQNSYGDIIYGAYTNQDQISGVPSVMEVNYTHGFDKDGLTMDYLEIIHFSSPQLIASSGYFGGEVRLAYLHHDGKIIPVSGFSISGNLYEMVKTMKASGDTIADSNEEGLSYIGPQYLLFDQMMIH